MSIIKQHPSILYRNAKELSECLYDFPYQSPSSVPSSVQQNRHIMSIISSTYPTTRALDGKTQQTTIDAAERIRLQTEFKIIIHELLEECLLQDHEHAPAFLLYPRIAEFNTRAKNRKSLILLFERFLPMVEAVKKDTHGYDLIKEDIEGMGGNCFDKVERHLADYHYELAKLYRDTKQDVLAKAEYSKANKLCSKIYGRGLNKIKLY